MDSLEVKFNLKEECDKALSNRNNYSFKELCNLAESAGFIFRNQKGSHSIYKHPDYFSKNCSDIISFQPHKNNPSKAKPYQVKQLISFIRESKPKR